AMAATRAGGGGTRGGGGAGEGRRRLRGRRRRSLAGNGSISPRGARPGVLAALFAGEPMGTLFLPHGSSLPAWKRWLGFTAQPKGRLIVDEGARRAGQGQNRSLLPIGGVRVAGRFCQADLLALLPPRPHSFHRPLP